MKFENERQKSYPKYVAILEILREKMKEMNLTYEQIAIQLGLDSTNRGTVHKWLNNKNQMNLYLIEKICEILKLNPNEVYMKAEERKTL